MNLRLTLKRKWFEITKAGIKTEDYREIKPYWCNRLLLLDGESKTKTFWFENFFQNRSLQKAIWSIKGNTVFKKFSSNTMTLGYPRSFDAGRILTLEHKGIEIRTGNPKWGAEPNKLYFVIKHGEIL